MRKDKFQRNVEVKWVIRKRVPTKILRQTRDKATKTQTEELHDELAEAIGTSNGKANGDTASLSATKNGDDTEGPQKKKQKTTTFNKDFAATRYLGDGNDPDSQQEANWRWLAGKYNTVSFLADRPLSRALMKKLSYNFVGEVVDIEPDLSPESSTLAHVTMRRLVLPEHTVLGRSYFHGPYDVFEDGDVNVASLHQTFRENGKSDNKDGMGVAPPTEALDGATVGSACFLRVPIEELVIVGRKVVRNANDGEQHTTGMAVQHRYSFHSDTYSPLEESQSTEDMNHEMKRCGRCRHLSHPTKRLAGIPHPLCRSCVKTLKGVRSMLTTSESGEIPLQCDCGQCTSCVESNLSNVSAEVIESVMQLGTTVDDLAEYSNTEDSGFMTTRFVTKGMNSTDFGFDPRSFGSSLNSSSSKPVAKVKTKTQKRAKKPAVLDIGALAAGGKKIKDGRKSPMKAMSPSLVPEKEVFKPSSARTLPYDAVNRRFDVSATHVYQWKLSQAIPPSSIYPEKTRNLRSIASRYAEVETTEVAAKKSTGRAARANQRRLVRSTAGMGVTFDTLAGREQHIRFDRSGIHDWGVFVDIDIREGEMIVEYRGEIIGNAVCEEREKKYFEEKIGSDYMFRIDEM
ncbi:MAG: hypothetical protein SGILL_009003, partial [Bacillariaceae sp.]